MQIAELWRYPVKSLAGQLLPEATLTDMGIQGDRLAYVIDDHGTVLTARKHPALLLLQGGIDQNNQTTVNNLPWNHPTVARLITEATGESARIVLAKSGERFDILPLLVATDGAIAAQTSHGTERRRFRPNILIAGVVCRACPTLLTPMHAQLPFRIRASIPRRTSLSPLSRSFPWPS